MIKKKNIYILMLLSSASFVFAPEGDVVPKESMVSRAWKNLKDIPDRIRDWYEERNLTKQEQLWSAAKRGREHIVDKLLNDPDVNVDKQEELVVKAGSKGSSKTINMISDDNSALHLAAKHGHAKIVKKLLEKNADHSLINIDGDTALHLAARHGHTAVVKELLAKDADIGATNNVRKTALDEAVDNGNYDAAMQLLNKKYPFKKDMPESEKAERNATKSKILQKCLDNIKKEHEAMVKTWNLKKKHQYATLMSKHINFVKKLSEEGVKLPEGSQDSELLKDVKEPGFGAFKVQKRLMDERLKKHTV